jgi:SAM-dependent methyltransferase
MMGRQQQPAQATPSARAVIGAQERAFLEGEADAYARRNPGVVAAPADDPVLVALSTVGLPATGALIDVGGAAGRLAAGFLRDRPEWSVRVVEPSGVAIEQGRRLFPGVVFDQGTITRTLPAGPRSGGYDVVVVCGVLCWVDRGLLSHAVAHTDAVVADGGLLVVSDFDAPFPRANPYAHRDGLFTYKQDYAACYLALGIYHLEYRLSFDHGSRADPADPYDRRWSVAILRKDVAGRYAGSP